MTHIFLNRFLAFAFFLNCVAIANAQLDSSYSKRADKLATRTIADVKLKDSTGSALRGIHVKKGRVPALTTKRQKIALPDTQSLKAKLNTGKRPKPYDTNLQKRFPKFLNRNTPKGYVSVSYDYGFLPYTVNMSSPSSAAKTEGQMETELLSIPFDLNFFYSTQKTLIGLTNYFRISYNAERYKRKLDSDILTKIDAYRGRLNKMSLERQDVLQRMAYTEHLAGIEPGKWPAVDASGIAPPDFTTPNSDTAGVRKALHRYVEQSFKRDSLQAQAAGYKAKKDSLSSAYKTYKLAYDQLNDSIKKIQKKIQQLESISGSESNHAKNSYFDKVKNFFSGVKKLDIGLCYPNYATFLTNNIPVRGINFEYQRNGTLFAFTYGSTVNTLLNSVKSQDGFMQTVRNSYNYFDFNNLSSGRKILAVKFGWGASEDDHFYGGFLVGKGVSLYTPAENNQAIYPQTESNLVLELDGRKRLSETTTLDVIIGKSSVQQDDLTLSCIQTASDEIFSKFRSYAALGRLKTNFTPTKSVLTFSIRWLDPFFNSFGTGFMRSDNLRYEAKFDQPLGKHLRYTGAFRREEDNLLKLMSFKNTFYSMNNTIAYKIKRGLMLRLSYTPLVRHLNIENSSNTTKNMIVTSVLSYSPKSKRVQKQFNVLYNNYSVNTEDSAIHFQSIAYNQQLSWKGGFRSNLSASWFKKSEKDSTGNELVLGVIDAGYQFSNGCAVSAAAKSAYKIGGAFYPGFLVKATVKLGRLLWDNQAERFIVGDLFSGYDKERIIKFPYCFTSKLTLNF